MECAVKMDNIGSQLHQQFLESFQPLRGAFPVRHSGTWLPGAREAYQRDIFKSAPTRMIGEIRADGVDSALAQSKVEPVDVHLGSADRFVSIARTEGEPLHGEIWLQHSKRDDRRLLHRADLDLPRLPTLEAVCKGRCS